MKKWKKSLDDSLNINDNHYQLKNTIRPSYREKEYPMLHLLNRANLIQQSSLPTLHSNHLFALTKEIRIQHDGEEYRLRLTRNNRLILTK